MTLGSLFDGSGGFPLAGVLNGITPVWSSEIEAYPLRVTAARFPGVKQLGDVTKIDGGKIEPVDIITFGSPCQDLSVAGKQLGIHEGQRSNLFFEAVRIIKEMRDADTANGRTGEHIRPRFAVWENVPGAFSSNKGADFKAVLEALASVRQDGLHIPRPKKWNHAGCVVGDGWSIAWRVYDAQYWGVPQRRKRIYLVADFASERAGEILFERESVLGNPAAGGEAREGTAADAERGVGGGCGVGLTNRGYVSGDGWCESVSPTLNTQDRHAVCYPNVAQSLCARADSSPCVDRGQNVVALDCRNMVGNVELSATLQAKNGGGFSLNYQNPVVYAREAFFQYKESEVCSTLRTSTDYADGGDGAIGVYPRVTGALCANSHPGSYTGQDIFNDMLPVYKNPVVYPGVQITSKVNRSNPQPGDPAPTLSTRSDSDYVVSCAKPPRKYIIRRLTPLECCRLQGFPDWWEDGVEGSDSARYRMWGNGIALPCAADVLARVAKACNDDYCEI